MNLQVFEPRYLIMVEEALKTKTPFGIVGMQKDEFGITKPASLGTFAQIKTWKHHKGDTMSISVKGGKRFKVLESERNLLGYWQGSVTGFNDKKENELSELSQQAETLIKKEVGKRTWNKLLKEVPPPSNPSDFSFWVGSLLPLSQEKKMELLQTKSPKNRLQTAIDALTIFSKEKKESQKQTKQ